MLKEKFNIEYPLKSVSPNILWSYIATPCGLANWFADDVIHSGHRFTFIWNKMQQEANQVGCRTGIFIRFRWDDEEEAERKAFFEFRIHQIELTGNTVLEVTDYALPHEKAENVDLWNTQIETLRRRLGL